MSNEAPVTKYRILTLDDFTKVPWDEIDDCLRAFKRDLQVAQRLKLVANTAMERELKDKEPRERDELMGGFEPAYMKRFLYYSTRPKSPAPTADSAPIKGKGA